MPLFVTAGVFLTSGPGWRAPQWALSDRFKPPADIREIETDFSRIEIYGGRMDATQMAQIGQD